MPLKRVIPFRITLLLVILLLVTLSCNFPIKFGSEEGTNLIQEIPEENSEEERTSAPEATPTEINYPDNLDDLEIISMEPLELETANPVLLLSTMISPQGGSMEVPDSGSPLDGLTILIPTDVYEENVKF